MCKNNLKKENIFDRGREDNKVKTGREREREREAENQRKGNREMGEKND